VCRRLANAVLPVAPHAPLASLVQAAPPPPPPHDETQLARKMHAAEALLRAAAKEAGRSAVRALGGAKSSLGDAKSSLGDAKGFAG
jgi:hypothetical protein